MVDDKGRPTRQALQAAAWGEPVPKSEADEKKLAAKGKELLEQYHAVKDGKAAEAKRPATKRAAKKGATKKDPEEKRAVKKGAAKKASVRAMPAEKVAGQKGLPEKTAAVK